MALLAVHLGTVDTCKTLPRVGGGDGGLLERSPAPRRRRRQQRRWQVCCMCWERCAAKAQPAVSPATHAHTHVPLVAGALLSAWVRLFMLVGDLPARLPCLATPLGCSLAVWPELALRQNTHTAPTAKRPPNAH